MTPQQLIDQALAQPRSHGELRPGLSFQEGYQHRRINVTLLYGEREKQAQGG